MTYRSSVTVVLKIAVSDQFVADESGAERLGEALQRGRKAFRLRRPGEPRGTRLERDLEAVADVLAWDPRDLVGGRGQARAAAAFRRVRTAAADAPEPARRSYEEARRPTRLLTLQFLSTPPAPGGEELEFLRVFAEDAVDLEQTPEPPPLAWRPPQTEIATVERFVKLYEGVGDEEDVYFARRAGSCLRRLRGLFA